MNSTFTKYLTVEAELAHGVEFSKKMMEIISRVPSNFVVTVKGHDGEEISKGSLSGKPVKESKKRKKSRRGLTSYLAFIKTERKNYAGEGVSPQDTMKKCALAWKELSAEDKKPYEEMAAADRAAKALEAGVDVSKKRKRPRRALTGYLCFTKAKRAEVAAEDPTLSPQATTSKLGALWQSLDAEGRKEYQDLAAIDKKRYLAEKEAIAKEEAEAAEAAEAAEVAPVAEVAA